jgi:hypothetical protein
MFTEGHPYWALKYEPFPGSFCPSMNRIRDYAWLQDSEAHVDEFPLARSTFKKWLTLRVFRAFDDAGSLLVRSGLQLISKGPEELIKTGEQHP